jgi:hypothetical protein
MIKPITLIAILALSLSAFAQEKTIKIKSRGNDIRMVIDTIFEQAGKQYVLETNFHQSLYMNLEDVSFQKAIDIISKITDMEFEERQGIWYIHKKPISSAQPFAPSNPPVTKKPDPAIKPKTTTKAPAKSPTVKKPTAAKTITAAQGFDNPTTPIKLDPPKVNLTGRLTVQLKKMDIRGVFAEFGQQAKVDIEVDDSVPNYKLDAFFYNTTLKFALDRVCKVAGLKYTFTAGNTVRVSKA